jgi:hypothetical protein
MSWQRATFVLIAICVALCGWIFVRDRDAPMVAEPQRMEAQLDANRTLTALTNASCSGCTAQVLTKTGATTWSVRLASPRWRRCFMIDVAAFGQTAAHGFSGLRSTSCPDS